MPIYKVVEGRGKEAFPLSKVSQSGKSSASDKSSTKYKTRFSTFAKNVAKSSKNVTIDVIGSYLPNISSVASTINDSGKEAGSRIKGSLDKVKGVYARILSGGRDGPSVNPKSYLTKMAKETFDDTVRRLRSGEFYRSEKEKKEEMVKEMERDLGFDMDFGDFSVPDSTGTTETMLSDEPFAAPLTSVEKNAVERNAKRRHNRIPRKSSVRTENNSSALQLTLGDKLNADTVQYSAQALIGAQENFFNRQFAADEVRHLTLVKFQESILNGVNAISDHLQNVENVSVKDTHEFQSKMISLQEDTMGLLRELKETVIVTSPSYEDDIKKHRSKLANILDGPVGIDKNEYLKNVKGNIMDVVSSSPIGAAVGLTPLIGSLLGSDGMGGLGKQKFDPLSMLLKVGANSMVSRQTRGRLANLNELAGGIGPLLIGRMNEMARFGNSKFSKMFGQIFGIKQMAAKKINLGVEDVDAKVSWSAKSDRTLNEVIPSYLSKMTAALTGGEETSYDYSAGKFRTVSSIKKEYERTKESAWYNSVIESYTDQMVKNKGNTSAGSILKEKNVSDSEIKKDIDTIMKNISKSGMRYSPEHIDDKNYREQITAGIKYKESFSVFDTMYNNATPEEKLMLNRQLVERGVNYENAMLNFNKNVIKNGGGGALQSSIAEEERSRIEHELMYSPHLQMEGVDINSPLYAQRKREILDVRRRLDALNTTGVDTVKAVRLNDDGTSGVAGIGSASTTQDVSTSMIGTLNNIYSLLGKGILVYPQKLRGGTIPAHIKSIYDANEKRASERIKREQGFGNDKNQSDEILAIEKELKEYQVRQNYIRYATIGDILGNASGVNNLRTFNPVNQIAAMTAEGGLRAIDSVFNPGESKKDATGIFESSQYERNLNLTKESAEASLNRLKEGMKKGGLQGKVNSFLYGMIEKQKNKQDTSKWTVDPITSIIKRKKLEDKDKPNKIIEAIQRTYKQFYNDKIISNKIEYSDSEEERTSFILKLLGALKHDGFTDKESLNIVSQVVDEPLGQENVEAGDKEEYVSAELVSNATGIPKENIISKFGSKISLKLLNYGEKIRGISSGLIKKDNIPIDLPIERIREDLIPTVKGSLSGFKDNIIDISSQIKNTKKEEKVPETPVPQETVDDKTPNAEVVSNSFFDRVKTVFGKKEGASPNIKDNINTVIKEVFIDKAASKLDDTKKSIGSRFNSLIKSSQDKKEQNTDKEAHKLALASYNVLEGLIQEATNNYEKEPSFDDIEKVVNEKIKNGLLDKDIAKAVMSKAYKIAKESDLPPLAGYSSAIREVKESYETKHRKDHDVVKNVVKKILKSGVRGVSALTLLVTGHPILAAAVAFGPKKTAKGALGGAKLLFKGSKLAAKLSGKILKTGAGMAFGAVKGTAGLLGNILSWDLPGSKQKKSREELDKEREIAVLAFNTLENLHREMMETNPDASLNDIKKEIDNKVKSGALDKDIADAVIKATNQNASDKDADATPLGAFLQAILALKKQYSKDYKKETSITRKIAMGLLKGVGKGIGAAALLMAGHPIMAAALALSGPPKLMKSFGKKFGKKGEKIPEANPVVKERKELAGEAETEVTEQANTAKESIFQKVPGIIRGAKNGVTEGVGEARAAISGAFGGFKDKIGGFFQERREGSLLDSREDKKEGRQQKIQEEMLDTLKEIKDNTHDTDDELDEKEERQANFFKKLGLGGKGGAVAGGAAGLAGLLFGGGKEGSGKSIINHAIDGVVKKGSGKLLGKVAGSLAGKGGFLGKIGGFAGKLAGAGGKTAATVASSAASSAAKGAGMAGKLGGLGGKAAGLLGKAGGLGGKAAGLLGKAGPALGGLAKFAGPVGIALAAGQALHGGFKGWKNASQIAGLEEGQEATTGQKVGSAASGALSALTLGLIKPEQMYGAGKAIGNTFKRAFGKEEPELDENGNPVIGPDGKPVMKKRGFMANVLRATPVGLAISGSQALFNKEKRDAAIAKVKGIGNKIFGTDKYELDENGEPKLDKEGNPIKKKTKRPQKGKRVKGKIRSSLEGIIGGEQIKKKTAKELLADIFGILSKGILVFPSELNDDNSPKHLKDVLKKGKFKGMTQSGGFPSSDKAGSRPSLFERGKEMLSNAWDGVKEKAGGFVNNIRNFFGGGNENSKAGGVGNILKGLFNFIKSPLDAVNYFYNNKGVASNNIENMLQNRQYDEIEQLADNIEDPSSMGQNKSVDSLSPEFGKRVRAFLSSPEAQAKGVTIREARRSPLTQLAYFTKGRAPDESFVHRMFKKAGFSSGAWSPMVKNTETLGSEHFKGNAIDIEDHGKGESYYKEIAPVAKKYGLEWGGDWPTFKDYPHFQLPENDNAVGYSGEPKGTEKEEGMTQRADGIGFGHGQNKAQALTRTITNTPPQPKDPYGTTTATSLHLNESPIITSEKELINQINIAINIQKAIYDEQKRHNNVSENFFTSLIEFLQEMNKGRESRVSSGNTPTSTGESELGNMASIMEADRIAKEYFMKNAYTMSQGI